LTGALNNADVVRDALAGKFASNQAFPIPKQKAR
jgi:hypothetical protein